MTVSEVAPAEQQELDGHGASVRSAAQWLVTSFAAVGALLVAGIQLQNVTQITTWWKLSLTLLSVVVALLATGSVIVSASRVLIAPVLTWDDLVRRETKQLIASQQATAAQHLEGLPGDPLLLELAAATQMQPVPFTSPRSLREELAGAREDVRTAASEDLQGRVLQLEELAQLCLRYANAWQSRQLYLRLIKVLKGAGTLIVVCIAVFLWASKPADEPLKVTKPFPVQVFLTDSQRALKAAGVDEACAGMTLQGSAVDGDASAPEVATKPAGKCPASRFALTDPLGVAVPVAQ
ncbi:hypothetical protein NC239_35460 [Streptomyces sp. G3]|uniref:hypothetical protein n=1 Tax=Streptomyces sp. G3 TaxID=690144 RepID=UPI00202E9D14|nr:hypothetical protein [Streptomyces sp. G3]MCM1943498.1 hypothetical protein [Streptomyces sp. G3]